MTTKTFDPRKLMELAVDVMVKSTQEPRGDGKSSPLVGAVLWIDGTIDTASRSELRDGDHAEFTLLERKHHSSKLDDAILFSTLEPCAPGARKHPKLSCAERIVLARIKEIWIGIEDPDPTVDRKGIKYLQDNGLKVHLFDRDLQERIRDVNREFIEQAEERAAAAREGRGTLPTTLSEFEAAQRGADIDDLSPPGRFEGVPRSARKGRRARRRGVSQTSHAARAPRGAEGQGRSDRLRYAALWKGAAHPSPSGGAPRHDSLR
jgi:ATP-dependent DNA helicase RecG